MTCYRPVTAFKPLDGGALLFHEAKNCREIKIKCGGCIGCRIEKREEWALRCYLESKMHSVNSFLTLTYDDDHYPMYGSLNYRHWQLFAKKLRHKIGPFRFYVVGEYGEKLERPHWHALLFGVDFGDKRKCNSLRSSCDLYTSEVVGKLWGQGFHTIGSVTLSSARYCAAYSMKKITGPLAEAHYMRVDLLTGEVCVVEPEMARMSLKPGIGYTWFEKYWKDIWYTENDAVIVAGRKCRIPKYFRGVADRVDDIPRTFMDDVEFRDYIRADLNSAHSTADRLAVREHCEMARIAFNKERYNNGGL